MVYPDLIHVANVSDLKDGEMKEVEVEGGKVLLSRFQGAYRATSNKCTHYGAPLKNGVITKEGRIVCPWHGACFHAETGDIEDGPALDSLIRYKVHTEGEKVLIQANPDDVKQNRRLPTFAACKIAEKKTVVIVGGGSGGLVTAETLREVGFAGHITILSAESYLPIDRIKLSKMLQVDTAKLALRSAEYLAERKIDIHLSTEVTKLDKEAKTVTTSGGTVIHYDQLVLATGGKPRVIPIKGIDLGNVFTLRHAQDGNAIYDAITSIEGSKSVLVIGSSFIGMEAAATASDLPGAQVTVVGMESVPFERVLGTKVGAVLQRLHESKGVQFQLDASISHIEEKRDGSGKAGAVVLASGQRFEADVIILGVGVVPATAWIGESGIPLEKDGSITVDGQFKVIGYEDIYAVGDIATFPNYSTGANVRIEHWSVAQNHGRSAAHAIAGTPKHYQKTPFFWTAQHGVNLRYCGSGVGYDNILFQGDLEGMKFIAFYTKGDEVIAVATIGKDPVASHCAELMRYGKMPSPAEIKAGKDVLEITLEA